MAEILHLLGDFSRDMATHLEGTPDEDGLLQLIRPRQDQFRKAIKATAPDFRPFAKCRGVSEYGDATSEDGLVTLWDGSISDDEFIPQDGRNVIYADEVLARAQKLVRAHAPRSRIQSLKSPSTEPSRESYQTTIHTWSRMNTSHLLYASGMFRLRGCSVTSRSGWSNTSSGSSTSISQNTPMEVCNRR